MARLEAPDFGGLIHFPTPPQTDLAMEVEASPLGERRAAGAQDGLGSSGHGLRLPVSCLSR
ncbi:hypothetical protein PABG_12003 [Paracoccidioides brasiliensis Pb03]|nr:hypothetical protein PABG_12003 [Paracoccidioides brasiliensis Pb03]